MAGVGGRVLTAQQQRAVDSPARALEIRAGAGTGKTTTLAHRVARVAAQTRAPGRLLVVTFTREATATLERRLSILLGRHSGVRVSSFHQWAARELPREDRRFLADDEARRILRRAVGAPSASLRRALGATEDGADTDAGARVAALISYAKNREIGLTEALAGAFAHLAPWTDELENARETYEALKGDRLDYDDLLVRCRDQLARSASFRAEVAGRLDHLFVDEYQDVNGVQDEIVHLVAAPRGSVDVTVVGDPRQSIYGFRGGGPEHLEKFLAPYGTRGRQVALTTCFRSSRAIVEAGNLALPDEHPLRARPKAPRGTAPLILPCDDPMDEARHVADSIETLLAGGVDPAEIAVLARSRRLLAPLVDELRARVAEDAWATREPHALTAALDAYRPRARGLDELARQHPRAAPLLARRARAAGLPAAPARAALLALEAPRVREVALMTIHGAKGLEWDHVFLVGAREGGLPSEPTLRAPEHVRDALVAEERRLLYVALTRARHSMTLTWSAEGRRREESRFLASLRAAAV